MAYILVCLIWGSTWMAIKIGLADSPPFQTAALRFLVALTVVLTLVYVRKLRLPTHWRDWVRIGYPGFFLFGINYAIVYFAEQFISSSLTAVLFGSLPFWVALLSLWLLKNERLPRLAWMGIGLGFAGVVLISYDQLQVSGDLFTGSVLSLVGCISAAFGTVVYKRSHTGGNILVTIAVQMIFGSLLLVPLALIFESPDDFRLTPATIGSILYLALVGTVTAFMLYFWLLKRLKAVSVALSSFITPIVAILIGVVMFGETFSTHEAAGAALVLSGVVLVVVRRRKPIAPNVAAYSEPSR
jgi:drug/metabolite transporter (DMT)-like permease